MSCKTASKQSLSQTKDAAIGIDLGTTYSCVAVYLHDRVEVVPNEQGKRIMPSCVSFTDTERFIGQQAKDKSPMNSNNTVFDAKRLIGRKFRDATVQSDMNLWPFEVISESNDRPSIVVNYRGEEKHFTPEQILSMILMKMKETAEAYLGSGSIVKNAVISVPACFSDSQRQATIDAGKIAGLNVMRIINGPTASVIAYALWKKKIVVGKNKNILVFDLGGGHLDVSIVISQANRLTVKAVAGDTHLGGQDFDNRLMNHFIKEFKQKKKKDISGDPSALTKLRIACEEAKKSLSFDTHITMTVNSLYEGIHFPAEITRARFEELNEDLFSKCIEIVQQCLNDAKMQKSDIDDVVLVGGSTRIPMVQELLKEFFDRKQLCKGMNPDEAVAYGAAVQAACLRCPDNEMLKNLHLVDVNPLSIGVEVADGSLLVIIPKNMAIPIQMDVRMVTQKDDQARGLSKIYEVECNGNNLLGKFIIGFPHLMAQLQFKVSFIIDANGIFNMSAVPHNTIRGITISKKNSNLSDEEVQKFIDEEKNCKFEDEEYNNMVYAKNDLERYSYRIKSFVRHESVAPLLSEIGKKKIEDAIEFVNEWLRCSQHLGINNIDGERQNLIKELKEICEPIYTMLDDTARRALSTLLNGKN